MNPTSESNIARRQRRKSLLAMSSALLALKQNAKVVFDPLVAARRFPCQMIFGAGAAGLAVGFAAAHLGTAGDSVREKKVNRGHRPHILQRAFTTAAPLLLSSLSRAVFSGASRHEASIIKENL